MIEFKKRYSIPFLKPMKIGQESVTKKDVLPFSFQENNKTFHFELSVLEGLHKENLEEAKESLTSFFQDPSTKLLPSALFAYEGAKFIHNIESMKVAINALFIPNSDEALPKEKTLKIKINRTSFDKDIELINILTKKNYTLRLDANRSLSKEDLYRYWEKIEDKKAIEYFEEPLSKSEDHLNLLEFIPVAFDESTELFINENLPSHIVNFVVKPSVIFGLDKTKELMKTRPIIVSSAFETPIQMLSLIKLSHLQKDTAMGLDTLKYFQLNSMPSYLKYNDGQIIFNAKNLSF